MTTRIWLSLILIAAPGCYACASSADSATPADKLTQLRITGRQLYHRGQYRDAATCFAEILTLIPADEPLSPTLIADVDSMAVVLEEIGDYAEARRYFERELTWLRHMGASGVTREIDVYQKLGGLQQLQGSLDQAEASFKKALSVAEKQSSVPTLEKAITLNDLGRLDVERGRLVDARRWLKKARIEAEQSVSGDSPELLKFLDSEAMMFFQSGKITAAEKEWQHALKIAENYYGSSPRGYRGLLLHLGQLYVATREYSAAEEMLQRCGAIEDDGADPLDRAVITSSLVALYSKAGRVDDATPFVASAIAESTDTCTATPVACAVVRSNLGDYYMVKGQWDDAAGQYQVALKLRQAVLGIHPAVADSLTSLARALRRLKKKKEARVLETQAADILARTEDPHYNPRNIVDVLALRAEK